MCVHAYVCVYGILSFNKQKKVVIWRATKTHFSFYNHPTPRPHLCDRHWSCQPENQLYLFSSFRPDLAHTWLCSVGGLYLATTPPLPHSQDKSAFFKMVALLSSQHSGSWAIWVEVRFEWTWLICKFRPSSLHVKASPSTCNTSSYERMYLHSQFSSP